MLPARTSGWPRPLSSRVVAAIFVLRVIEALCIRTWFNPDETWQGPEVAHRLVFGVGHVTWEWQQGLRSILHPALFFVPPFALLKTLGIDSPASVVAAVRIVQAGVQTATDVATVVLAGRLLGGRAAALPHILLVSLTAWFSAYCGLRTYANGAETLAVVLALLAWPSAHGLAWAAAAVLLRPTAAVPFLFLAAVALAQREARAAFIRRALVVGVVAMACQLALDSAFYGRPTSVLLTFLQFNLLSGGSAFYGTHAWHWYLTQGLPANAGPYLPFALVGVHAIWREPALARLRQLVLMAAWTVAVYSLSGHKEQRFLLPLQPLLNIVAGVGVHRALNRWASARFWLAVCLLANVAMFLGLGLFFQADGVTVVSQLTPRIVSADVAAVLFLNGCHNTPYYSNVHLAVPMHFLDCSPPADAAWQPTAFSSERGDWQPTAELAERRRAAGYEPETDRFAAEGLALVAPFLDAHAPGGRLAVVAHADAADDVAAQLTARGLTWDAREAHGMRTLRVFYGVRTQEFSATGLNTGR